MLTLFCLVIYFVISWYTATCFDKIADEKGARDSYFWICFWLGLPGWIMVCALPDRRNVSSANPAPLSGSPAPTVSTPYPAISDELPDL